MSFLIFKCCTSFYNTPNITFTKRDIKEENPTAAEIKDWHERSKLDLKKFFNTSGLVYRELNLKERLKDMTEEEQYQLLSTDGMLVKRPITVTDTEVLVGPLVKEKYL